MDSRFDADKVVRLVTLTAERRLEMQFADASGNVHAVSLPLRAAVDLGCIICDVSNAAPFAVGGVQRAGGKGAAGK